MAYTVVPAVDDVTNEFPPSVMSALAVSTALGNQKNGVTPMTSASRDSLTGAALWDGRVILNTTIDRIQRYDLGLLTWRTVADQADISAATSILNNNDNLLVESPTLLGKAGVLNTAARTDHQHPIGDIDIINTTSGIMLSPGITLSADGCYAARRSGWVLLEVYIYCGTAGANVLTMPSDWKPTFGIRGQMNLGSTSAIRAVYLGNSGLLSVEGGMTVGQVLFGNISYPVANY